MSVISKFWKDLQNELLKLLGIKNVLSFLRDNGQLDAVFRLLEERALSDEVTAVRVLSLGVIARA